MTLAGEAAALVHSAQVQQQHMHALGNAAAAARGPAFGMQVSDDVDFGIRTLHPDSASTASSSSSAPGALFLRRHCFFREFRVVNGGS